jgi:serine/threonine protein kinase
MTRPLTAPGRLVAGRYRLHEQIGGGGMGAVWLARDELLGRQVALKQILLPSGADAAAIDHQRQRALREGRIAARLSHRHAISVYDVALEDGQPWLVMEYLPSRSLAAVLAEDGVLRVDQVAQIGAQVADALAATHAAGIVHRDVKPANVLIGRGGAVEGLVKITDFGIAHASGDVTLTQTGQITATPAFLAPEVAQGHEMTPASDVFSLGATLYTCLEGTPPFGMDENALATLHRVAGGVIQPPTRAGQLTRPLLRMLDADPAARPTMTEVRDDLARLAAGRDGDTTTVLLARTDLRPARTDPRPARTLTSPLGPPAGADGSAPPPSGPVAPEPPQDETPPKRRGVSRTWTAIALVTLLLVGLIVFWVVGLDSSGSGAPQAPATTPTRPSTSAPATTAAPTTTAQSSQPPSTTEGTTESSAGAPAVTAKDVKDFLEQYHELVIEDPAQAWALTGPTLRSTISEDDFIAFWNQFDDVKLSGVQAEDGSLTATGNLEYRYRSGERSKELRQFTLVVENGHLLLDSDRPA